MRMRRYPSLETVLEGKLLLAKAEEAACRSLDLSGRVTECRQTGIDRRLLDFWRIFGPCLAA